MVDNDKPRMAVHGYWTGGEFVPDCAFTRIPKAEQQEKALADKKAERRQRARIGIRAQKGKDWDGKADNDNIAWPLATSLIREGNTELLKAAVAYRRIYEQAYSGVVLGGTSAPMGKGMALDQRTHIRPNGTIAYKGARQVGTEEPESSPTMKVIPYAIEGEDVERNVARIPKPWNGDRPVNDMLDAQSKIIHLRTRLGVLVEPLEMSVVDGETYQAIGNSLGIANRAGALGAGCAAVHMALVAVRDALGDIKRQDLAA